MRRIITLFLTIVMIVSSFAFTNVFAVDEIKVKINGVEQNYDVMPVIVNGRTLVPMRGIYEALGAKITWIDATKTVVGSRDNKYLKLKIDSDSWYINGVEQPTKLDVPATIINSRTMVPIRFVAESFGEKVDWDADTKTVLITSDYLNQVAVSDKLAILPSRFHRDIPREFEKSSELGDWLYYDMRSPIESIDLSVYGKHEIMFSPEEFLEKASFSANEKMIETKYGSLEIVDVEGQNFKKALRVKTHTVPEATNQHVLLFGDVLKDRFKAKDHILLSFKLRLVDGGAPSLNGVGYAGKVWPCIQQPVSYRKTIWLNCTANSEWRTMYIPAQMGESATDLAVRFGYCDAPQTVEVADFKILNFGEEAPRDYLLPKYTGEEYQQDLNPDAQWRKDAADRIEKIRKGDFRVVVKDKNGNPVPGAKVNFDMYESQFPFGSVFQITDETYAKNWSKYFNASMLETEMKWGYFEQNPDKARPKLNQAREMGALYLRDHAMIYERHMHTSTVRLIPDDVMDALVKGDVDYVDKRTKEWIYRISDLFAGEFFEIDVSNEISVLKEPGNTKYFGENNDVLYHSGGYYNILGPEYYNKIYKWVDEVNPQALMYYTDSTALVDPEQRKTVIDPILESLYKNEHHFEGIGIHGHSSVGYVPFSSFNDIYNDYYEKYGAVSSLTEYSINSGDDNYDANFARDSLINALANEHFNGFYLWGFMSKSNTKCFVDPKYNLKPAGKALVDVMYNKCYTHDAKTETDANGEGIIRGFYGNYDVTIESNGKTKKVMAAFHKGYDNILEINIDDDKFIPSDDTVKTEKEYVVNDAKLPEGGKVIITPDDFLSRITGNKFTKYASKDSSGIITINIPEKPEKDTGVQLTMDETYVSGKINPDDVCMFTFKAKLSSGGENGQGYIKPYVQKSSEYGNEKALFDRTEVGTEWVTCYLPFIGKDNLSSAGIRFGGMAQKVELKDVMIINYGKSVDIKSLPSTIIE